MTDKNSSFAQRKEVSNQQRFIETYTTVMALYCALKDIGQFHVKRAQIRQGEVPAEALDFICDVEIKARRALSTAKEADLKSQRLDVLAWYRILRQPETYDEINKTSKEIIGKAFYLGKLDVAGPYKKLYFKAKNARQ